MLPTKYILPINLKPIITISFDFINLLSSLFLFFFAYISPRPTTYLGRNSKRTWLTLLIWMKQRQRVVMSDNLQEKFHKLGIEETTTIECVIGYGKFGRVGSLPHGAYLKKECRNPNV